MYTQRFFPLSAWTCSQSIVELAQSTMGYFLNGSNLDGVVTRPRPSREWRWDSRFQPRGRIFGLRSLPQAGFWVCPPGGGQMLGIGATTYRHIEPFHSESDTSESERKAWFSRATSFDDAQGRIDLDVDNPDGEALRKVISSATRHPEVLVVDDDATVLDEILATLGSDGIECIGAENGRQALSFLRGYPSLLTVLVDLRMPEMDGFALMHAIRDSISPHAAPAIVCVSGHLDMDATVSAMRHGARDCLTKPVSRTDLLNGVHAAVASARQSRQREGEHDVMRSLLSDLQSKVSQVAMRIGMPRGGPGPHEREDAAVGQRAPGDPVEASSLLDQVRRLIAERERRRECFPGSLLSDPAWDMLLDLVQNQLSGHLTYVSSLAVGARVPLSTTSRYLDMLEKEELVERFQDPMDKRRVRVNLTDSGWNRMHEYLDGLV